ncbi:MAG: sigma-70 family RNA polymerase sigma factor [Flavobacteriaceae bacterium]|nr:sigma-70 family RNA polymerase sigma factor [Flavobacteriaceae bacterium]
MEIRDTTIIEQIQQAKLGKQSAFKFLLDHYWNMVFGYQIKRTANETDAEDITIETFAKAFDKIDSFEEDYKFSTWLVTISRNIQIDKIRKHRNAILTNTTEAGEEQLKQIPDTKPTPEDLMITKQNLAQLLHDIKLLKPAYQQVITLRYFQEMSYKEISQELEVPLSNVKVRLLRARKLLLEIINSKD